MPQKYAVYLNGKALFFNNNNIPNAVSIQGSGQEAVKEALKILHSGSLVSLPEIQGEQGIEMLKKHFPLIAAAGGIVESIHKRILLIHRLGSWDLPKGKVDQGETNEQAASREIHEETGVYPGTPLRLICRTWHVYRFHQREVLKETYWYLFNIDTEPVPVVQTEENITRAEWLNIQDALALNNNMYDSVKDVLVNYSQNVSGPIFK
jgi:8-oxo-dGTP pyrophosphatase MutT (NUDIX family)